MRARAGTEHDRMSEAVSRARDDHVDVVPVGVDHTRDRGRIAVGQIGQQHRDRFGRWNRCVRERERVRHAAFRLVVAHDPGVARDRADFRGHRIRCDDDRRPGGRRVQRVFDQCAATQPFEQLLAAEAPRGARCQDDDGQALTATRVRIGPLP